MADDIVIRAEHISKEYRLGVINHGTLYRDMQSWWARYRGRSDPNAEIKDATTLQRDYARIEGDVFHALDDISFEVKRGDIVGVIGGNGAGKSTLLKVLSRITAPSTGVVKLRGRMSSLLEVGTGFHPELTGRENVFLNGAILGMSKFEVSKKFDEIVEFAGLGEFVDTPVKRYSSGMYVRLAFSVAAHLESEILLIDEVLAVGDLAFQRKCLGKMQDISSSGRTILFVSHNIAAIENLCTRSLVLKDGRLGFEGSVTDSVNHYLASFGERGGNNLTKAVRSGDRRMQISDIWFEDLDGNHLTALQCGAAVSLHVQIDSLEKVTGNVNLAVGITTVGGDGVLHLSTETSGLQIDGLGSPTVFVCALPRVQLRGGAYTMNLYLAAGGVVSDWVRDAFRFHIEDSDYYGTGKLPPAGYGVFLTDYVWKLKGNS